MTEEGRQRLSLPLGVVGMVIGVTGAFLPVGLAQKWLFLACAGFMVSAALLVRHRVFTALQLVVIAGTLIAFVPAPTAVKVLAPMLAALGALTWLARAGAFRYRLNYLGMAGLILLALGFAISRAEVYLAGGLVLTVFSVAEYRRGIRIGLLWALLNGAFAFSAALALLRG